MDLETLQRRVREGERHRYLFFWGHKSDRPTVNATCLSQWYPATFTVDGQNYATAEHFMMAEKARLFGDSRVLDAILQSRSPGEAKALGRKVVGFDEDTWTSHRFGIVVRGSLAKFGQHDGLREFLCNTKSRVLVEASPQDRIWGIGLAATDSAAENPQLWRGQNLLGFALMEARTQLLAASG